MMTVPRTIVAQSWGMPSAEKRDLVKAIIKEIIAFQIQTRIVCIPKSFSPVLSLSSLVTIIPQIIGRRIGADRQASVITG